MSDQNMLLNGFRRCEKVLSNIALGASDEYVFSQIQEICEATGEGRTASIFLLDSETKRLQLAVGNQLPDYYNKAINDVEIGEYIGSCGAAAYLGQAVIVDNIQSHQNWAAYRGMAQRANLAACWSVPIMSSKGKVLGTFALYSDKTSSPCEAEMEILSLSAHIASVLIEKNNMEKKIEHISTHDQLTELASRTLFENVCLRTLKLAERKLETMSFVYIDLNNFSRINDKYTYSMGDRILKVFAAVVNEELRSSDMVARMNGDEFIIALADTSLHGASQFVTRLDSAFTEAQQHVSIEDNVSMAVGIADVAKGRYLPLNDVISQAEKRMRKNKKECKFGTSNLVELVPNTKSSTSKKVAM